MVVDWSIWIFILLEIRVGSMRSITDTLKRNNRLEEFNFSANRSCRYEDLKLVAEALESNTFLQRIQYCDEKFGHENPPKNYGYFKIRNYSHYSTSFSDSSDSWNDSDVEYDGNVRSGYDVRNGGSLENNNDSNFVCHEMDVRLWNKILRQQKKGTEDAIVPLLFSRLGIENSYFLIHSKPELFTRRAGHCGWDDVGSKRKALDEMKPVEKRHRP